MDSPAGRSFRLRFFIPGLEVGMCRSLDDYNSLVADHTRRARNELIEHMFSICKPGEKFRFTSPIELIEEPQVCDGRYYALEVSYVINSL